MKRTLLVLIVLALASVHCIAQSRWEETKGPLEGHIATMSMDSAGAIHLMLTSEFVSINDGASWTRTTENPALTWSLASSIDADGSIYYLAENKVVYKMPGNRAKTTGLTGYLGAKPIDYAMALRSGKELFVSCMGELKRCEFRSGWNRSKPIVAGGTDRPENMVTSLAVVSDSIVYAATLGGIFKSYNNGDSWERISESQSYHSLARAGDAYLYAASDSALEVSTDGGDTWRLSPLRLSGPSLIATGQPGHVVVAAISGEVFVSTNHGISWKGSNIPETTLRSVLITRNNVVLVGSEFYGVFRSTDGGTSWVNSSSGINNSTGTAVAVAPNGRVYAGGINHFEGCVLFNSTDGGENWHGRSPEQPGNPMCFAVLTDSIVLCGKIGSGIYRTTDGGTTWAQQSPELNELSVFSFLVLPDGNVLAGVSGGLYRSSDSGLTWSRATLTGTSVLSMLRHPDGTLLAGSSVGPYYSTDNGVSWSLANSFPSNETNRLAMVTFRDGSVFAISTISNARYGSRSTDVGRTWKRAPIPGIENSPDYLGFLHYNLTMGLQGEVYLGGNADGIYRTTDNGNTWLPFNSGLVDTSITVNDMAVDSNGTIWAVTNSRGVIRTTTQPAEVAANTHAVHRSELHVQAIPNPFAGTTSLAFTLLHTGVVSLKIYDPLGHEVATLVDKRLPAGVHLYQWNPEAYHAGTYLIRLQAGDEIVSETLVLNN